MKLSAFVTALESKNDITFVLPNGKLVPQHFHITEVGLLTRDFVDCGGVVRQKKVVNFQLWTADDTDHRLAPEKLLHIIALSDKQLGLWNHPVQAEYQWETIWSYDVVCGDDGFFHLIWKNTDCLAKDACGVPQKWSERKSFWSLFGTRKDSCSGEGCC